MNRQLANMAIRQSAKDHGVHLWQIGNALGFSDANFSRKLRVEFSEADRNKAMEAIQAIAAQQTNGEADD